MRLVLFGQKGSGKTTLGKALAQRLGLTAWDTDALIEEEDARRRGGTRRTCREIYVQDGEKTFRSLERDIVQRLEGSDWCLVITGAGLMMDPDSRRALRPRSVLLYLWAEPEVLWQRATTHGVPPWLQGDDGKQRFFQQVHYRDEVLRPFADVILDTTHGTPENLVEEALNLLSLELHTRMQSANTYGEIVRITNFGESHGPAVGVVLDGLRPGIEISRETIQHELDRRRPGQSKVTTQRKETDEVQILSGMFEGKTTGAPLCFVIFNKDQRSANYEAIRDVFRPGHGDFTFYKKYGFRDWRGGGRQSARETAGRVAAGAVARDVLAKKGVRIIAHAVEIAGIRAQTCDYDVIEKNPVRCADPTAALAMEEAILKARSEKDSVGGIIQLEIHGLPPGLGDPVFGKLDARLASALLTIGATKGVEIGTGFALARMRGSEANDPMKDGRFLSNHHGGILGGISTGEPVIVRVAVKPTASIAQQQHTVDEAGRNRVIEVLGRHDPCIVPRAVPVIENMAALVILDAWYVQARINPAWTEQYGVP